MSRVKQTLFTITPLLCMLAGAAEAPQSASPIDMQEMLDDSTLAVAVIQDWHVVPDRLCPTRQKHVTIRVGTLWPGQDYRIPVRMIVPTGRKAKGFHLTGGHNLQGIQRDFRPRGVDAALIEGGVGLVQTIVQEPATFGQGELAGKMASRFIRTLDPRYSVQYWAWPATLLRAITAAYAETDHFEKGRIAATGGSKNGATPSEAMIQDERITAVHATVSPICESPLRLCDKKAWDALDAYEKRSGPASRRHHFLGGTFGPIYTFRALDAGHSWEEVEALAHRMAPLVFVSLNLGKLEARGVDMLFHPGTHDFVAFDMAWCGEHYPQIPIYLKANTGHGKRGHPAGEKDEANLAAFLLNHFFGTSEPLLKPPTLSHELKDGALVVTVKFRPESGEDSGRIWWMFDRGLDGSEAYLRDMFPDDQWKDMTHDPATHTWTVAIPLEPGAAHIDVFSNHGKTVRYKGGEYRTYISSPYTRVKIPDPRTD